MKFSTNKIKSITSFTGWYLYHQLNRLIQGNGYTDLIEAEKEKIRSSVNIDYFIKIENSFNINASSSICLDDLRPYKKTGYTFDLMRILCMHPDLQFNYLPGDIKHVPDSPTIVRSRPISDQNSNSVLLPLNTRRLFEIFDDVKEFEHKIPKLIWRGAVHKEHRINFLKQCFDHPLCDVGANKTSLPEGVKFLKDWKSPRQQIDYRYQFIIEGNDIASNIRWALNSNSLCFMRKPRYETWFSEGLLIEQFHYVRVADDFSDVVEKIEYYEKNPAEAMVIIENAQKFVRDSLSLTRQYAIARLVMEKYFHLSGQI